MSYYYNYNFTSPEILYSEVKEDFKTYFDTGSVDDLMFPTYLNKCLEKLGKSSYSISEEILYIEDFEARLPDNFHAAREAWMCVEMPLRSYQTANSFYSQTSSTTIQIEPLTIGGTECTDINCPSDLCPELPYIEQAVYKTNYEQPRSFRREFLLTPGNLSAKKSCDVNYGSGYTITNSPHSAQYNSFDIRDNKFVTTFREGVVYLVFYSTDYDGVGNQMVPDNYRIKEYIISFLKYKVIELLTNQITDETFNQLQQKLVYYKQLCDEAFIMASLEVKKQTVYEKQRAIKKQLNSFAKYELPNRVSRNSGWRR